MTKYIYLLFFMYSSVGAVQGLQRDPFPVTYSPVIHKVPDCTKKCDERVPDCLDNLIKSSDDDECDAIDRTTGGCIIDGLVKLLACIGILP